MNCTSIIRRPSTGSRSTTASSRTTPTTHPGTPARLWFDERVDGSAQAGHSGGRLLRSQLVQGSCPVADVPDGEVEKSAPRGPAHGGPVLDDPLRRYRPLLDRHGEQGRGLLVRDGLLGCVHHGYLDRSPLQSHAVAAPGLAQDVDADSWQ